MVSLYGGGMYASDASTWNSIEKYDISFSRKLIELYETMLKLDISFDVKRMYFLFENGKRKMENLLLNVWSTGKERKMVTIPGNKWKLRRRKQLVRTERHKGQQQGSAGKAKFRF